MFCPVKDVACCGFDVFGEHFLASWGVIGRMERLPNVSLGLTNGGVHEGQ
jgi:hypothetical protein